MISILLATVAGAADPETGSDPVVEGLKAELARGLDGLSLPDAPSPYYIGLRLIDGQRVQLAATYGGLLSHRDRTRRQLYGEVRVGSPDLDNSNFQAFRNGFNQRTTVHGADPLAIRHDAWLLLDESYKESIEAMAAKEAARRRRAKPDDVPDFAPGPPQVVTAAVPEPVDADALAELAKTTSALFLDRAAIEAAVVFVGAERGRDVVVDTRGTEVVRPVDELAVRVAARARAEDGMTVVDEALILRRSVEGPVTAAELETRARAIADRLETWRTLPKAEEAYVGPVVFEGEAAIELVHTMMLPALQGTPPEERPPRGSRSFVFSEDEGSALSIRRRLLPDGWTVDDDPMRNPQGTVYYTHDAEGEPAQKVTLVDNGIVRAHLMTRTPTEKQPQSTGHARGPGGRLLQATPADIAVRSGRSLSAKKLRKRALKAAAVYGLDHYMAVRQLQDPAVREIDVGPESFASFFGFGDVQLPSPVVAVKVFADGHEEPVRGFAFSDVDRRVFREVLAAGPMAEATVLMAVPGLPSGPVSGLPVHIHAPSMLVGEIELVPSTSNVERAPQVPSPLAKDATP